MALIFVITGCGISNKTEGLEYGKEDYKKIVSANNQLSFKLLPELEVDQNGNFFISPISLFMALSMVYNGAEQQTKEEIANVLQSQGIAVEELNKANASWMAMLQNDSDKVQLHIANSIWLNENFHFQDKFSKNVSQYFDAEVQEIDVFDRESSKRINDWVKKSTNKKITEIVSPPLNSDLLAILLNAIYFKGDWKFAFGKEQTAKSVFYVEDGTIKDVEFMRLKEELSYLETEKFQAVSLPYGDGKMSMKVFAPKEDTSLVDFEKIITNEHWDKWLSEFELKEGMIILPKFQLEYEVLLNEPLQNLGMITAFEEKANFTKMTQESEIMIDIIKQKTFINVNEEGTEAAAVTSVEMVVEMASVDEPFYMNVNRPFFIAITDEETGAILFMGWIANPLQNK